MGIHLYWDKCNQIYLVCQTKKTLEQSFQHELALIVISQILAMACPPPSWSLPVYPLDNKTPAPAPIAAAPLEIERKVGAWSTLVEGDEQQYRNDTQSMKVNIFCFSYELTIS